MNKKGIILLIILSIIFIVCLIYLLLSVYKSIEESWRCIGENSYIYTDLDNNKGRAIDCDKNFQPYLTCELEDGRIIQVKEYKREIENLCD